MTPVWCIAMSTWCRRSWWACGWGSGSWPGGAEIVAARRLQCRVERRRRRDHSREQRGLRYRELRRLLLEVALRRGAYPVRVATEVDGVEVALEDVVLRQRLFEPDLEHGFADLAL